MRRCAARFAPIVDCGRKVASGKGSAASQSKDSDSEYEPMARTCTAPRGFSTCYQNAQRSEAWAARSNRLMASSHSFSRLQGP